jgi:rare lipoprotein A
MPATRNIRLVPALAAALALALGASGCATTRAATLPPDAQIGVASYYAHAHDGRRTASGERFDMTEMTAAHRTLPFGTIVRVTNLANGRRAIVRINDRGPFKKKRIIDVSLAAAKELGMLGPGTARVRLEVVGGS